MIQVHRRPNWYERRDVCTLDHLHVWRSTTVKSERKLHTHDRLELSDLNSARRLKHSVSFSAGDIDKQLQNSG